MTWLLRSGIALCIYTGLCLYIGWRFFAFVKLFLPSLRAWIFWPLYALVSHGLIVMAFFRLARPGFVAPAELYWPAVFTYILLFLVAFDLAGLALSLASRDRLRLMPAGVGAALLLAVVFLVYGSFHARTIHTAHYELSFPGKTGPGKTGMENFRVVLVSDLHIGSTVGNDWVESIVDRINDASPDIVCLAGDIFNSGMEGVIDPSAIAAELRRINAPVYACLGNHDVDRHTRSTSEIARFLKEAGIILLADNVTVTGKPGVYIVGRRDARSIGTEGARLSIKELTASVRELAASVNKLTASIREAPAPVNEWTVAVNESAASINDTASINNTASTNELNVSGERDSGQFVILLDHQPSELPLAAEAGVDLVLCGHTHRGQFFPANLITYYLFRRYGGANYGHWQKGATQALVTSGAGVWGPPVRIGTNSEIAVLDLRF